MRKSHFFILSILVIFMGMAIPIYAQQAGDMYLWEFNEGSGDVVTDNSGQYSAQLGFSVSDTAVPPEAAADSPSGRAGDFSVRANGALGVDDGNSPILAIQAGPITIECWVKIEALNTYNGLVVYGDSYKIGINNGNFVWTFRAIEDVLSSIPAEPDSAWHHIAMAWEPGIGVTFYYDGQLADFKATSNTNRALQSNLLEIGSEANGANAVQGSMDRVRIHHAVLDETQIDSDAASPKPPLADTVVAYNFDEGQLPYQNGTRTVRPAIFTSQLLSNNSKPAYVTDNPKGAAGDYSLYFDGNDRVIFPDDNDIMQFDFVDFTFEAWVKFDTLPGDRAVLFAYGIGGQNGYSFSILRDGRRITVTTYGILDAYSDVSIPDDGQWHHIAAVHQNGVEFRYYLDGQLGQQLPYTDGVRFALVNAFLIGHEANGGLPYRGYLDRIRISRAAFTEAQLDYFTPASVENWSLF